MSLQYKERPITVTANSKCVSTNEEYRKLVNTSGTASKESVLARKEYFKKIVNSL